MIIKQSENRTHDIEVLNSLLALPDISTTTQNQIIREIKNIQSGVNGEKETAYQMAFHYGETKNWMVIHDLRLEYNGQVAQIDHLLINRFLEIYVCESKRFNEGISINEYGEFSAYYKGRPYGIPSPIEQNNQHIRLLEKILDSDHIELPTRLGFKLKPKLISLILVANSARISRPKNAKKIQGLERIIKNEQLYQQINRDLDQENIVSMATSVTKVISSETLQTFAQSLAALHRPLTMNWKARFGITDKPEATTPDSESIQVNNESQPTPEPKIIVSEQISDETTSQSKPHTTANTTTTPKRLFCAACKKTVSPKVAHFCWNNKARFQGKVYCFDCQKDVKK
ncbi:nuclease-related domain-containing protein [Neisseria zalophi]|uniref:NERD domain-containing protein n=1 Tax=Neisseria zalophi TaxID=640030 RepID=A0A5J6PUX6_9NEIS|nr:nuclease-related domain-containing protein [Neisseria zalophi]QEY26588.1 NERD domain-containing protein [Neisseria zalophi]